MTETEAIRIMGMFVAAYPSSAADDATIDLWVNALATVDSGDGAEAAMEWIRTSKFFPTIAEMNEILAGYRRRRELTRSNFRGLPESFASFEDGCAAAKAGYLSQCRMQGREPNPRILAHFDAGWVGAVQVQKPA